MRSYLVLWSSLFLTAASGSFVAADDDLKSLQGIWVAQTLEADGKPVPADVAQRMKFTFAGEKLLLAGNFKDDRVLTCSYKVDSQKTPKQLEFIREKESQPILGIYELQGDELRVCLRHAESTAGRPAAFATQPDSQLVLVVMKRQKP